MLQRGLDILNTARTLNGETVREWLDGLLKNKNIYFWFGAERYTMTKGLHIIAWYKNKETGKGCDLWPWERDYIAEALYPDTQKIIDTYNDTEKQPTSKNWRDFLELLQDAKIDEHLKKSLEWYGEAGLRRAIWDEQNANK